MNFSYLRPGPMPNSIHTIANSYLYASLGHFTMLINLLRSRRISSFFWSYLRESGYSGHWCNPANTSSASNRFAVRPFSISVSENMELGLWMAENTNAFLRRSITSRCSLSLAHSWFLANLDRLNTSSRLLKRDVIPLPVVSHHRVERDILCMIRSTEVNERSCCGNLMNKSLKEIKLRSDSTVDILHKSNGVD